MSKKIRNRRKFLSQNFLSEEGARKLAKSVRGLNGALVIEVGTGSGVLTKYLSDSAKHVYSFEIDDHLARKARKNLGARSNICVQCADFLQVQPPAEQFVLAGNVPFSITTDVLYWALDARLLNFATLLVQEEVAKKRTGIYGRWTKLTIKSWPTHNWELGDQFPARFFNPRPSVNGRVLYISHRKRYLLPRNCRLRYCEMVDIGFKGRGGSLLESFRRAGLIRQRDVPGIASSVGISQDVPVGLVTPEQWLNLMKCTT